MSENRNSELSDDTLTLVLIGAFALMLFGPTLAARLIPQAASFLVDDFKIFVDYFAILLINQGNKHITKC